MAKWREFKEGQSDI